MTQHRNSNKIWTKSLLFILNQIKYLTEFKNLNRALEITTNSAIQLKIFVLEKRAGLILM